MKNSMINWYLYSQGNEQAQRKRRRGRSEKMKIKNKSLFVWGIIILLIGVIAYFSDKITSFDLKIYGGSLFVLGMIVLIQSLIGSSRTYPLKMDEKLLKKKKKGKK